MSTWVPPLGKDTTSSRRRSVVIRSTFHAVCDLSPPLSFSIEDIQTSLESAESGLGSFLEANVQDVTCFNTKVMSRHEYLIIRVQTQPTDWPDLGQYVYMRCERNPKENAAFLNIKKGDEVAMDTVKLSHTLDALKSRPDDHIISQTNHETVQVAHVIDLLAIAHHTAEKYTLTHHNCWWLAAVCLTTLSVAGQWVQITENHWRKEIVKVIGNKTGDASDQVFKKFLGSWLQGTLDLPMPSKAGQSQLKEYSGKTLRRYSANRFFPLSPSPPEPIPEWSPERSPGLQVPLPWSGGSSGSSSRSVSPDPTSDIDLKTFINRNALSAEEARIGYDLTFAKFGQDMSKVRSRFIGAAAALRTFNILATSATLWGEKDPERRDYMVSTTALEAVRQLLVYAGPRKPSQVRECDNAATATALRMMRRSRPVQLYLYWHPDIGNLYVDAIVNSAKPDLLGGRGRHSLDTLIHTLAGSQLYEACKKLGGALPGQSKITPGFRLKSKHIIHTVGPIYRSDFREGEALLGRCYASCLALAKEHKLHHIVFPCISAGANKVPVAISAGIGIKEINYFLDTEWHDLESIAFMSKVETEFAELRTLLLSSFPSLQVVGGPTIH